MNTILLIELKFCIETRKKGKNFEIYFNETKLPKEFRYINITDEKFLAGQLYDGDEISERVIIIIIIFGQSINVKCWPTKLKRKNEEFEFFISLF